MAVVVGSSAFQTPSIDSLWSPKGQLLGKLPGSDREFVIADVKEFTATPELTEQDYKSRSFPRAKLMKTTVFSDSLTLNITLATLSKKVFAALFMGNAESTYIQTAVTGPQSFSFLDAEPGDIFSTGLKDITVTDVTDTSVTPIPFVEGVHYSVDRRTGRVECLALPSGADGIEFKVTAPAITAADGRQSFGILETSGLRLQLFFRELSSESPFNFEATYWDVELRPSGAIPHVNGEEYADIELTGKVYAKSGKPAGKEYGELVIIPKTSLV